MMKPSLMRAILRAARLAAPPPKLSISRWADEYLHLSAEDSAEPGKYSSARAPYQRGIMDAFHEEMTEMALMSSAQIGKTSILKAIIGYHIHVDPCPILMVQPTVEMAETFSKDRLSPMIRDTPVISGKVSDAKSRDSNNTILKKNFPGGHVTMVGANAPAGLASRPIRIVLCDEVDRYPPSAGSEGDPVNLARKRAITFRRRRRMVMVSTPTVAGASRIERAFLASDQRRYHVPCPHCGHRHVLKWENVSISGDDPETAMPRCPECGALIEHKHKREMLEAGEWIAENPEGKYPGFHLNELYSPWRTFADVAADYYAAKGNPEEEKAWWNTSMGEPFAEAGVCVESNTLLEKRQNYDVDTLPAGVICVTAGVDVQGDRLEIEFVGWGAGAESWGIHPRILRGNTGEAAVWTMLDDALASARFKTEDGRMLRVIGVCVDSGHETQNVYEFCTPRAARNIWAIKGQEGARPIWPRKITRSRKFRGHVVRLIGVDSAKETIYSRFAIEDGKPGCCHFSMEYEEEWFIQATVETMVTSIDTRGRETRKWVKPRSVRNEALDCRVYAYAAMVGLKVERGLMLARQYLPGMASATEPPIIAAESVKAEAQKPAPLAPLARRRSQSRYLGRT
ncbi:MAG: phage terminase large subunit family protein [Zoogloeaceae bacterium]|nr:phage terminase large subunit family protein [Zoogloeaceae bacterium]